MAKHILIDSSFGLIRTAIANGGRLLDYYEESLEHGRAKGNIYKGIVKKVDAHIQAAFVRYGSGRDGFLPLRDVPFRSGARPAAEVEEKPAKGRRKRGRGRKGQAPAEAQPGSTGASAAIGPGDEVLVQVVKDEAGSKGAALTTKLSLSGRYLVYMPDSHGDSGISSRLSEDERAALKKAMAELRVPDGASVILRTAALNKTAEELQSDLDRLVESHREFSEEAYFRKEPGLVYRDAPPAQRYLREYYTPDVEKIWVNREDLLAECREFFNLYEPLAAAKVHLSGEGALMFQQLGLEAEVERLSSRKVTLPSGANFVIDQAEALVAIDVNSAKSRGDGGRDGDGEDRNGGRGESRRQLEDALFAVNMEAGAEIARQLRLRDLGGIIVVDFIDMEEDHHKRKLEEAMRRALSADKAKVKVYDISPLGIMQISRQRLRKAGAHGTRASCAACQGRGWQASPAAAATAVLRRIEERLRNRRSPGGLTITVPFPVANSLHNEFRPHVVDLEQRHGGPVRIFADPSPTGDPVFSAHPGEAGEGSGARGQLPREEVTDKGRGRRGEAGAPESRREGGRAREGRREGGQAPDSRREGGHAAESRRDGGRAPESRRERRVGRPDGRPRDGRPDLAPQDRPDVVEASREEPFEAAQAGHDAAPAEAAAAMAAALDIPGPEAFADLAPGPSAEATREGRRERGRGRRGRGRGGKGESPAPAPGRAQPVSQEPEPVVARAEEDGGSMDVHAATAETDKVIGVEGAREPRGGRRGRGRRGGTRPEGATPKAQAPRAESAQPAPAAPRPPGRKPERPERPPKRVEAVSKPSAAPATPSAPNEPAIAGAPGEAKARGRRRPRHRPRGGRAEGGAA